MNVAVVTDSTAGLPTETLASASSRQLPLTVLGIPVLLGSAERREGDDISSAEVAKALSLRHAPVTTSRLSPGELAETYQRLFDEGFESIVSIHLSKALSGTVEAAQVAAADFGGRVAVVDSRGAGMGLGYPVLEAVAAAREGASSAQVVAAAVQVIDDVTTYFYVDTLEYLRRGGRISAAAALVGTALSVKPILKVSSGGEIQVHDKVRTPVKGMKSLAELAASQVYDAPVELTVHHLGAEERAEALVELLHQTLGAQIKKVQITEVGAAIGAHCGPGLVGVVVYRPKS